MNTYNKPGKGFLIIAVLAVIWNCMGVFQFIASTILDKEKLAESYSAPEVELFTSQPSWYTILFGICTITGLLGSIFLVMRKKLAVPLFLISLLTVLIVQGYWLLGTNAMEVVGVEAVVMPLIVIILCIFLYFYSKGAAQKGWLS